MRQVFGIPAKLDAVRLGDAPPQGWPCRNVANRSGCETAFRDAYPTGAPDEQSLASYLVVQNGDDVSVVQTWAQLQTLIGPIDTPYKAALVATMQDRWLNCNTSVGASGNGWDVVRASCEGSQYVGRVLHVTRTGEAKETSAFPIVGSEHRCLPGTGRRPQAWLPASNDSVSSVGKYFASCAELEAASVFAFEIMADELARFSAPRDLQERCLRAARDERRHERLMTRLARRHGCEPVVAAMAQVGLRSLFAFALDNAVEGCLRETFSALLAQRQADIATHPDDARALRIVARDELRHAALSWDLAAWVERQITARERATLVEAKRREYERMLWGARDLPIGPTASELRSLLVSFWARIRTDDWSEAA